MIVVTCKLEVGVIEDSLKLILIIYKQLPSSIWRVIPNLIFTLYAPTYKAGPLLPSTLETLTEVYYIGGYEPISQRFRF